MHSCLTNLDMSNLHKSRVATMLVFRFSHLPVLVSVPPEKEGRMPILCVVSQSQWVIIVGAPLHLHCVPDSFPSSLGSTVCLGTFSIGVGFLIVERQLLAAWSISWGHWSYLSMPTWVTFGGGECLNSGGCSPFRFLFLIWSFSVSSAVRFVPRETSWSLLSPFSPVSN